MSNGSRFAIRESFQDRCQFKTLPAAAAHSRQTDLSREIQACRFTFKRRELFESPCGRHTRDFPPNRFDDFSVGSRETTTRATCASAARNP